MTQPFNCFSKSKGTHRSIYPLPWHSGQDFLDLHQQCRTCPVFGNNVDSTSAIGDLVLPSLTNKRRGAMTDYRGVGAGLQQRTRRRMRFFSRQQNASKLSDSLDRTYLKIRTLRGSLRLARALVIFPYL